MIRLDLKLPVREIKTSRRSLTGRVSLLGGGNATFESSLERDWLISLDFDPSIQLVREQPFSLFYKFETSTRRYTPDVLVEQVSPCGNIFTIVYEVKPRDELIKDWQLYKPRFKAAVNYCRAKGWRFKIVTEKEIRTPFVRNAKFLRRYRHLPVQQLVGDQLRYTLRALGETTPQALLAAAYLTNELQMTAVPELWRLIASRKIAALLDDNLTMSSAIWLPGD
ncbi:hypothetical protein AAKU64_000047 [Undibacterium sp. GrIS 1.8]|uniref:heteromeric transposase endonuclease subunit TnsA n=1 Tax=Undibacterium sp. GrIS 1.8 TaxID=3143934 RepID=UPI00339B3762